MYTYVIILCDGYNFTFWIGESDNNGWIAIRKALTNKLKELMKSDSKEEKENPDFKRNRGLVLNGECLGSSFRNFGKEKESACDRREMGDLSCGLGFAFCGLIAKECICCPEDQRCGKLPIPTDT